METKIQECPELNIDIGCTTIILNTSARSEDALLRYFETEETEDSFTKKLKQAVEKTKQNNIVLWEFMRFADYVKHEKEEAEQQGIFQGIQEGKIEGAKKEKQTICKMMLQQNIDISVIETCTNLSRAEILDIQNKMSIM